MMNPDYSMSGSSNVVTARHEVDGVHRCGNEPQPRAQKRLRSHRYASPSHNQTSDGKDFGNMSVAQPVQHDCTSSTDSFEPLATHLEAKRAALARRGSIHCPNATQSEPPQCTSSGSHRSMLEDEDGPSTATRKAALGTNVKTEQLSEEKDNILGTPPDELSILRRLIVLHKEKDDHDVRLSKLKERISQDERDIGKLLAEASRYQEAARQRREMTRLDKLREEEESKFYKQKTDMIEDLQRKLATLYDHA